MPHVKRRPTIAVTGPDHRAWLIRSLNGLAVRRAGGRLLRVTPRRPATDGAPIDGLLIIGGADVDPALYGQQNVAARHVDPPRDRMELDLLRWALAERRPVLGVCRGAQLLNVALGGTLYQEASEVFPRFRPTRGLYSQLTLRRPVRVVADGWVRRALGGEGPHPVNSLHHQAIALVAPALEVVAVDEHGMTQAVESRDKTCFTVGVQWHPELMQNARGQRALFAAFVRAAAEAAAARC
jgi:putative glutamine amidotransferase